MHYYLLDTGDIIAIQFVKQNNCQHILMEKVHLTFEIEPK